MMMYLKMHIIKYSICIWHKICILKGGNCIMAMIDYGSVVKKMGK